MDDAELVRQVLLGNVGAYGELANRYIPQIAALARAHVPQPDVAEDIVQEVMFRGLDRIADLTQAASFGFWLYAIARNLCRDWHNDPNNGHASLDAALPAAAAREPGAGDHAPDRIAALKACIRHLPVDLREVVEIYYSGGRVTYRDLADRLGVSFATVAQRLGRARRMLRVCLERAADNEIPPA